jgi:hypothetical protein
MVGAEKFFSLYVPWPYKEKKKEGVGCVVRVR